MEQAHFAGTHAMTYRDLIAQTANQYGVPVSIALAVAQRESGINQYAANGSVLKRVEPSGKVSYGIFQLLSGTAADMGVDPMIPEQNILGGVKYLRQTYDWTGNWHTALQAYNGGIGNVQRGTVHDDARRYADAVMASAGLQSAPLPYTLPGRPFELPGQQPVGGAMGAPVLAYNSAPTLPGGLTPDVFANWNFNNSNQLNTNVGDDVMGLALGGIGLVALLLLV